MKNILGLVAEVEDKAVAILDSAKEEKQRIKEEENKNRLSIENIKKNEYQLEIALYQSQLDMATKAELDTLEDQMRQNKNQLNAYFDKNKTMLVNQLTKQVIGE